MCHFPRWSGQLPLRASYRGRMITCNGCGATNLRWTKRMGRSRLIHVETDQLHTCLRTRLTNTAGLTHGSSYGSSKPRWRWIGGPTGDVEPE